MTPTRGAFARHPLSRALPPRRLRSWTAMLACAAVVAVGLLPAGTADAAPAPAGQGFRVTPADLAFILQQIRIAERHAATQSAAHPCDTLVGTEPDQIPSPLLSFGLRTVDGSCNNLQPGQETYGAADRTFPRLTTPVFGPAEDSDFGLGPVGPPGTTSYAQTSGSVVDSEPRTVSNLIVDQTYTNPAAVAAATRAVRAQSNDGAQQPCEWTPGYTPPASFVTNAPGCTPSHETLFIENVTTDVGLSPPFNSLFTIFGQFFDHGLDKITNGGNGTVFVPLGADDPLVAGPDHTFGTADDLPASQRFMLLTRGTVVTGADGFRNAPNTDTPFVDQSQTYTSHASHQVFLREYVDNSLGRPVSTGRFLSHAGEGLATWTEIKAQAATTLGLKLTDADVADIPMLATDPYGKFVPGPARGLPQFVTGSGLVEGNRTGGGVAVPADVVRIHTAFLNDIAHSAAPTFSAPGVLFPDADGVAGTSLATPSPAGSYDDELLGLHAICGDGRCNENIALQAVHQVFHSEHDRLVGEIKSILASDATGTTHLTDWQTALGAPEGAATWNGERLFQAARFVTEMQYQHLVFEEFARKVQPAINPFEAFAFNQTDVNPAITAEFAHAVYRFGHSMLDDDIPRMKADGTHYDIPLLDGFLNPAAYYSDGTSTPLSPRAALTDLVMGLSDQPGNEIDEFVADTLRNNLLGLPLDLPALNMTRARSEGIPPLNQVRRQIFAATNDGQLAPYTNWVDFGEHLRHPESLVNFVAAYGTHPLVTGTVAQRRLAAERIVNGRILPGPDLVVGTDCGTATPSPACADDVPPPADAADFMFGTGAWGSTPVGLTSTGLDDVDLWVGGLAENTNLFGGLLGSTFNYVFENQLTNLQNGDRFYYLARTPGMNLRASLEGNSFAELVMRNSDAHTLKADPFATADCKFETGLVNGPASTGITGAGSVNDVPSTECDENALLLRQPNGTVKYRSTNSIDPPGINGQAVYNGTAGTDRIYGGNDNDTFWGGESRDWIDGGGGDDVILGGDGDDVITDFGGADVPKGGPGDDAIDAGPGDDIVMGGDGNDFTNGGANLNEHFLGEGNDFAIAGQGTDAVFGDGGDDWEEGGDQPDLLIGDSSTLFFDDHNRPGHDVLIGQGGDDDYDMEGGDDIGVGGPGVEKNAGASGWDWVIGQNDPQPQFADLSLPILNAPPANETRDRFNEVEAVSGWKLDDRLLGDDIVPSAVGGGGFIGCDALDQAGLDRITGLAAILPPLTGAPAVPTAGVVGSSVTNYCLLSGGFVWGQGNILLGGEGSDTLTGRGADDVLDGDRWLRVRISYRSNPADPLSEIGSTELMESAAATGSFGPGTTGMTLQQAVFAGLVDPGNLVVVREVVTPAPAAADCQALVPLNCDTAVFLGPRSNYTIVTDPDGTVTVTQVGPDVPVVQKVSDGVDTVRNVERLRFSDADVLIGAAATLTPAPGLAFGDQRTGVTSSTLLATVTNTGTVPVTLSAVDITGANPTQFSTPAPVGCVGVTLQLGLSCTIAVAFTPATAGPKSATLTVTRTVGGPLSIPLTGNGVLATTVPSAPAIGTTLQAVGSLTPRWTPGDDGGVAVTGFLVRVVDPAGTQVGALRPAGATATGLPVVGLTVGTAYRFQVAAVNPVGTGAFSALSAPVVFATAPGAPTNVSASRGGGGAPITAQIKFRDPATTGGLPIAGFRVYALNAAGTTVLQGPVVLAPGSRNLTFTFATNATVRLRVEAFNALATGAPVTTGTVTPR